MSAPCIYPPIYSYFIFRSTYLSIYKPAYLSIYLSMYITYIYFPLSHQRIRPSIYLPVNPSPSALSHPLIRPFTYLSVPPSPSVLFPSSRLISSRVTLFSHQLLSSVLYSSAVSQVAPRNRCCMPRV